MSNTSNNNNNNNTSSTMSSSINGGGGGGPSSLFAGNLMSDHHHQHHQQQQQQQHLFNNGTTLAMHNEPLLPQMSATALLQKAAQMGATSTSNASSLLRGFATSSSNSSGAKPRTSFINNENINDQSHNENERHLQDLMNSLTNEGAAMFGRFNNGRDTMTRDFLGVGSMVRSMAGGGGGGIDMGSISMDSDIKSASSSRSFAGGALQ